MGVSVRRAVLAIVAATAMLTGCGGGAEGSAVAAEPKDPWDPCSVPDEAIDAIGLDSTTKKTWGKGMNVPEWLLCYWKGTEAGTDYFFGIRFSPAHSVSEIANEPESVPVATPTLGGRTGVQYRTQDAGPDRQCALAIDTSIGVANFDVSSIGQASPAFDACDKVLAHAAALQVQLPPPAK